MQIRTLIDRGYRLAYRIAYPIMCRWWRFHGLDGVSVAVWCGDHILAVRHSYKPGLHLPGGGIGRREDPRLAAVRELEEEVGLIIDPADLHAVLSARTRYGHLHLFEITVKQMPQVTIDRREIIEAIFVPPNLVRERNRGITAYLEQADASIHQPMAA